MSSPVAQLRSPSGRTAVVQPTGDLDLSTLPSLEDALDGAYRSVARTLVVDLQHVAFVEWTTVGALLRVHRDLGRAGRTLVVVNVGPGVVRTLRLLDRRRELRVVPLERLLTPAWLEEGALSPAHEDGVWA